MILGGRWCLVLVVMGTPVMEGRLGYKGGSRNKPGCLQDDRKGGRQNSIAHSTSLPRALLCEMHILNVGDRVEREREPVLMEKRAQPYQYTMWVGMSAGKETERDRE